MESFISFILSDYLHSHNADEAQDIDNEALNNRLKDLGYF